jgi:homoaconitase/3-isopropylmalate dehydratase large subunit
VHKAAISFPPGTAEAHLFAARAALWTGDAPGAVADLAEVAETGRRGRAIDNDQAVIRAGIAALEGRTAEALAAYRQALRTWRDLGCVLDEAFCAIDMAMLLDPTEPEVQAAAASAREILARLGAKPLLALLDAAMSAVPTAVRAEPPERVVSARR